VLVRKVTKDADLLVTSMVMLAGGIPSSVLFGVLELTNQGIGEVTIGIIAGILFLGLIATALAMSLWNYAFSKLPAATASLTFFAQPVVGTFLGWFFLGEKITSLFIIGGILIGAGLLISNTEES
jgi:drug/metabolite transporter (DMT)-like permease